MGVKVSDLDTAGESCTSWWGGTRHSIVGPKASSGALKARGKKMQPSVLRHSMHILANKPVISSGCTPSSIFSVSLCLEYLFIHEEKEKKTQLLIRVSCCLRKTWDVVDACGGLEQMTWRRLVGTLVSMEQLCMQSPMGDCIFERLSHLCFAKAVLPLQFSAIIYKNLCWHSSFTNSSKYAHLARTGQCR